MSGMVDKVRSMFSKCVRPILPAEEQHSRKWLRSGSLEPSRMWCVTKLVAGCENVDQFPPHQCIRIVSFQNATLRDSTRNASTY